MHLKVMSPEQVTFDEDVREVVANTSEGQIAILPHHVNLVAKLEPGEMIVKTSKGEQILAVAGGFLEIEGEQVTVLADHTIRIEDIDVEKALAAQKRAEEILKKTQEKISEKDFAIAQSEFNRSILQLKVARRRRSQTATVKE